MTTLFEEIKNLNAILYELEQKVKAIKEEIKDKQEKLIKECEHVYRREYDYCDQRNYYVCEKCDYSFW